MELVLYLLIPALTGAALAALLCFLRGRRPSALPWPIFSFLAVLGTAANNTAAVWFAGGDAFFPSGGFFGGDNLTAALTGVALALVAVPGLAVCLGMRPKRPLPPTRPAVASLWGWLLAQGGLSILVFLLGFTVQFQFQDGPGLPLAGYLLLTALLCAGAGFLVGWRSGAKPVYTLGLPLLWGLLCAALAAGMLAQAHIDPSWGLDLTQTPAGLWYTRLNLSAAVLLGDYQYAWDITPIKLYLSALVPQLLYAAGALAAIPLKRGKAHG